MSFLATHSLTTHKGKEEIFYEKTKLQKNYKKTIPKTISKKNSKNKFLKKVADDGNIYELQSWMYSHNDSDGRVTNAFLSGLETFMYQADSTPITQERSNMLCPCQKCKNSKFAHSETVWKHLVNRGFTPQY